MSCPDLEQVMLPILSTIPTERYIGYLQEVLQAVLGTYRMYRCKSLNARWLAACELTLQLPVCETPTRFPATIFQFASSLRKLWLGTAHGFFLVADDNELTVGRRIPLPSSRSWRGCRPELPFDGFWRQTRNKLHVWSVSFDILPLPLDSSKNSSCNPPQMPTAAKAIENLSR